MSEPRGDGEGGPSERNSGAGGPASGAPGSARRRRNSRPSSRHSVYTEEPEDEIDERHQSDDSFDEDDEELGSRRTTRRRRVSFSTQPYRTHHRESSFEHQYDPLSFGDRSRSNNSNGGASAYAYVQTVPNHQYAAAGPNSHARHSSYPNPRYYPPQTLRPGRYVAPTPVHPNPFNPTAHPRPLTDRFGPGPRTQASAPNYVGHNSVWVEQNQYYPATYPQGYPTEYLVVRHARASSATRPPEADDRARHDHKSAPRRSASLSRHNHTHSKRETRDESNRSRKDRHASAARRQPEPPRDERRTKRSNREGRQRSRERMERLVEDRVESAMRRQAAASREVEQQPDFARRQMEWERSFFLGRLMNNQAEDTQSMVSRASRRVADIENVLDALDIVERRRTQVAPDPIPRSASVAPEHIYDAVFHAVRQGIAEQPQHVRPLHVERPSTVVPPAHAYDYPDPSPASSFAPPTAGAGWHNNPEDFPRRFEDRQPDVSTRYEPRDIPYSIITNPGAADQTYQPHQVPRRQVSTPGPPPGFNPMLPTPPDSDALSPGPSIGESNPFMSSRPHPPNIGRGPSSGPYRPPAGGRSSGGRGPALNVNTSNQGLPRRPLREYSSEETDQETFLHHPRPYSAAGGSLPIAPDPPSPSTTRSRPSSRGRRLRRAVTFEEVEDEGEDGPDGHFRNFRNR